MHKKRLIVIGGGAAGFFCAVNAARLNPLLEVLILEKSNKLLAKVKVSGGGRCNITHACFSIAEMVKHYPRGGAFLKKAFHHFFTSDTIDWFAQRGVPLIAEADGRMFPESNNSQTIIDCLLKEANRFGVQVLMNREVKGLAKDQTLAGGQWTIALAGNETMTADFICTASGGHAKPLQYQWLRDLGITLETPVPSLFTFNMPGNAITALMGVTVNNVRVKIAGSKLQEEGPLLITHWGMSGPAVLKLSAWGARQLAAANYHFTLIVNWVPEYHENSLRDKLQLLRFDLAAQKMINRNPFGLPARLWEYLLQGSGINKDLRWADLPAKEQQKLIKQLCSYEVMVAGKTTFKEEFVTAGGISLNEIDFNTMQSKIVPGLFFAGEVMDIDGVTGGFNFQHAWTSGWIAAKGVSAALANESTGA